MGTFETLNALNVNEHVEKKLQSGTQLTYLSWTWAWAEIKKRFPDADYTIWKDPVSRLPYVCDPMTGYMVYTSVTIENQTHEMWLPVMDGQNKAMKPEPYEYSTKNGKKTVQAATMFDINKTIMRCLVKNLAMFGLGLYIYAGEDLPETEEEPTRKAEPVKAPVPDDAADIPILCEVCHRQITDYTFAKGTKDAAWIGKYSRTTYGKQLCGMHLAIAIEEDKRNANS